MEKKHTIEIKTNDSTLYDKIESLIKGTDTDMIMETTRSLNVGVVENPLIRGIVYGTADDLPKHDEEYFKQLKAAPTINDIMFRKKMDKLKEEST
jgi:hypothetical protein